MIQINQHNYEEFVLDYLEGSLSNELRAAMDEFFTQNPEIAFEVNGLDAYMLNAPKLKLTDSKKQQLKRVCSGTTFITEENYEQVLFQAVEGTLSSDQYNDLQKELALSPWLNTEFTIWQQTKVKPFQQKFSNKADLLQKAPIFTIQNLLYAAAAVTVGLVLGSALWFMNTQPNQIQLSGFNNNIAAPNSNQSFQVSATSIQLASLETRDYVASMPTKAIELPVESSEHSLAMRAPANYNLVSIFRVDPTESVNASEEPTSSSNQEYYPTVKEFLVSSIKKSNLSNEQLVEPEKIVKGDFIAIAANSINKVFKTKIKVEREFNANNDPVYLAIQTEKFKFDRKINPRAVTKR